MFVNFVSYLKSAFTTAYWLFENVTDNVRLFAGRYYYSHTYSGKYSNNSNVGDAIFIGCARFFLIMLVIVALANLGRYQKRSRYKTSIIDFFFDFLALFTAPGKRTIFLKSIFAVLAKVAQADGIVSDAEIASLEKAATALKLSKKEHQKMTKYFNYVLGNDNKTLNDHLKPFMKAFSRDITSRLLFIRVLFALAAADKYFAPQEEIILKSVAAYFKITPTQYNAMRKEFFPYDSGRSTEQSSYDGQQNSDWHRQQSTHQFDSYRSPNRKYYDILGLSPDCSNEELKKAHRELVLENHPDRLLGKCLPQQALNLLNERFLQIQDAYEQVRNMRGIR